MPVKWDSESELKLAMAVIKSNNVKPKAWENVASMMGGTYTGEGVRQHYQKMLKSTTFATDTASTSAATSTLTATHPTTSAFVSVNAPKVRSPAARAKPKASSKKRKKDDEEKEESEVEEEEGTAVGGKKMKKEEDGDDDDEDKYIG
ncbi:hypothetical protein MMC27_001453 [Xylographa pallens]|nr:hypothetical protein [Xylographa pallens]